MSTKSLNLIDAVELLKTLTTDQAMERDDLQLFLGRIENSGKSILEKKGIEYIDEVSTLLLAAVMAETLSNPDTTNMLLFMLLQDRPDVFKLILGYAFIYAVGVGVVEELY